MVALSVLVLAKSCLCHLHSSVTWCSRRPRLSIRNFVELVTSPRRKISRSMTCGLASPLTAISSLPHGTAAVQCGVVGGVFVAFAKVQLHVRRICGPRSTHASSCNDIVSGAPFPRYSTLDSSPLHLFAAPGALCAALHASHQHLRPVQS